MKPITGIKLESSSCCCGNDNNCIICGKPLVYSAQTTERECAVCHKKADSNASCEAGHFVCDACHSLGAASFLPPLLLASDEKNPQRLFEIVMSQPQVHMHGPEHHFIVPCVLLVCYKNCGGALDLGKAIKDAVRRGKQVSGGSCGYWGACGAAVGAGIYASVVTGSSPLNAAVWPLPQKLVSEALSRIADAGGPRCCKRTGRTAISAAVAFTRKTLGVAMEDTPGFCTYSERNRECIKERCPYYEVEK